MRWIVYAILGSSLISGAVWAASSAPEPQQEQEEEKIAPFVPTEKVPVDSAISFPVDI
jgi:hypothetical protein